MSKTDTKELALDLYDGLIDKPAKRILAAAFDLSRSSLYYQSVKPKKDLKLKNQILSWWEVDDTLGSRKLAGLIGRSRSSISRVMSKYGLETRKKQPKYSYPGKTDNVVENKLLNSDLSDYEIFFSDIFQFRLADRSWVYCCFIIKRKTRQILSFAYSWGMRADLVETTINRIDLIDDLTDSKLVFHSDQGKQYGAKLTIQACLKKHFTRSMSRAGTPTDNPIAERFVQTFKLAVVERYSFQTIGEFKEAATKWLNFYNNLRPHDSLNGLSPNKFANNNNLKSVSYLSPIFV